LSPKRSKSKKNNENNSLQTQNSYYSPARGSLLDLGVKDEDPLTSLRPLSEIENVAPTVDTQQLSHRSASVSFSPQFSDSEESILIDDDVGTLNKKKRQEFRRSFGTSKKLLSTASTNATILPHREERRSPDPTSWHGVHQSGYIARAHHPWSPDTSLDQNHDQDVTETANFPDDPFSDLKTEGSHIVKAEEENQDKNEIFDYTANNIKASLPGDPHPSSESQPVNITTSTTSSFCDSVKTEKLLSSHFTIGEFLQLDEKQREEAYRNITKDLAAIEAEVFEKRELIESMSNQVDGLNQRVHDFEDKKKESFNRQQTDEIEKSQARIERLEEELVKTRGDLKERELKNEEDKKNIMRMSLTMDELNNEKKTCQEKQQQFEQTKVQEIETLMSELKSKDMLITSIEESVSEMKKNHVYMEDELAKAKKDVNDKELKTKNQEKKIAKMLLDVKELSDDKAIYQEKEKEIERLNMEDIYKMKTELEAKEAIILSMKESISLRDDNRENILKNHNSVELNINDLNDPVDSGEGTRCTTEELCSDKEVFDKEPNSENQKMVEIKEDVKSDSETIRLLRLLNKELCVKEVDSQSKLLNQEELLESIRKDMKQTDNVLLDMKKELKSKKEKVIDLNETLLAIKTKEQLNKSGSTRNKSVNKTMFCSGLENKSSEPFSEEVEEVDHGNDLQPSSPISTNEETKDNQGETENLGDGISSNITYLDQETEHNVLDSQKNEDELLESKVGKKKSVNRNSECSSDSSSSIYWWKQKKSCDYSENNEQEAAQTKTTELSMALKRNLNGEKDLSKENRSDSSDGVSEITVHKSRHVDMEMPVGTTRASVAMAAVRAMKNSMGTIGVNGFLPKLQNTVVLSDKKRFDASEGNKQELSCSRLRAKNFEIKELEESYNTEISNLMKKNVEFAKKITVLEDELSEATNALTISSNFSKVKIQTAENLTEDLTESPLVDHSDPVDLRALSLSCAIDEDKRCNNKVQNEEGILQKKNEELSKKIEELEGEVDDVSALLAETISAVKINENHMDSLDGVKIEGVGIFGRFSLRNTNEDLIQLEKICRVHQFTVLKQRERITKMETTIEENISNLSRMTQEAKANEEKIVALECQFSALNEMKDNDKISTSYSGDSLTGRGPSIIKIDATYVADLKSDASKTLKIVEDQRNQLVKEKERYDDMKEKVSITKDLQEQISTLKIKLQARDATITALEKAYKLHNTPSKPTTHNKFRNQKYYHPGLDDIDYLQSSSQKGGAVESDSEIEFKAQLVSKEAQISNLQSQLCSLEKSAQNPVNEDTRVILSLRRVSLLQEVFDASIRRLNVLLNKLEDNKTESMNEPFVFSVCEKYALMRDYLKVSLHLLESKISNELESIRMGSPNDAEDMGDAIHERFDLTIESLRESEKQIESYLEDLRKDISNQNIKTSAKDDVIEDLLRSGSDQKLEIESLRSELKVLQSLSKFSCLDSGVIATLKELSKIQEDLQEKERIIQRLNNVIEEYRVQEDLGGDVF